MFWKCRLSGIASAVCVPYNFTLGGGGRAFPSFGEKVRKRNKTRPSSEVFVLHFLRPCRSYIHTAQVLVLLHELEH